MHILVVADEPEKALWDYYRYQPQRLKSADLILSCGDLKPQYLEFMVTFANCPLLYVHGNHDEIYDSRPPEGCICIEDKVYIMVCGSWDWAEACATRMARICIQREKCGGGSVVLVFSCSSSDPAALTSCSPILL